MQRGKAGQLRRKQYFSPQIRPDLTFMETDMSQVMYMPIEVMSILHSGYEVATELPAPHPEMRAFVMVIPRVPSPHYHPEAWDKRTGKPVLRDVSFISGYELRYLLHHAKYTDTDWG